MATKKRGLGKGLNELLSATLGAQAAAEEVAVLEEPSQDEQSSPDVVAAQNNDASGEATTDKLVYLSIDEIKPGPFQPRNTMTHEGIEQLSESIKQQGVIQPIVVRQKAPHAYEILAGERRWRASRVAELSTIPAIVRAVPDEVAMAIALIENIQREDLNPMEQSKALKRLADDLALTHLQVAEMVGKSRAAVTNLLRLLSLNPDVQSLVAEKQLEMGHARALLGLQGALQSQVARTVIKRGLSVRETERIVVRLQEGQGDRKARRDVDPNIRTLERDLANRLGAPVLIRHGRKGSGTVVIRYSSSDELDGILAHIN